jgi:intracellular septation protein
VLVVSDRTLRRPSVGAQGDRLAVVRRTRRPSRRVLLMKLFFDFLPIILFFGVFKVADMNAEAAARYATEHLGFAVSGGVVGIDEAPVLLATVVVMAATLVQIGILLLMRKKVDTMLWVTFGLIAVLGGATIWFHDPTFIKWKPSALDWAMALALWLSQAVFGKNLLQVLVGGQLELPKAVWQRLNLAWIAFFTLMGVLNLYVAYNFSTSTWATFKVFGLTGLMLAFMVAQGFYISRFMKDDDDAADEPAQAAPAAGTGPDSR